jgi:hypothetical protein
MAKRRSQPKWNWNWRTSNNAYYYPRKEAINKTAVSGTWGLPLNDLSDMSLWVPFDDYTDPLKLYAGTGSITFTRTHDATHTATYIHPVTGLVTLSTSNAPRIETNGILLEGSRENRVRQSEVFKTTWTASNVTIADNTTTAPDGNSTADTLSATADNATIKQSCTFTVGVQTFSVYLKRKTGTGDIQISADDVSFTTCSINSTTWTRCYDSRTLAASPASPGIRIVTNGDEVYAWGAQYERGVFMTSYIPTTTTSIIRNMDVMTIPYTGNIDRVTGTVAVYGDILSTVASGLSNWFISTDAGGRLLYSGDATNGVTYDGTTIYEWALTAAFTANTERRMAVSWGTSKMRAAYNGTLAAEANFDNTMGDGSTAISFGGISSSTNLYGHLKNVRIWSRKLSTVEITEITGSSFVAYPNLRTSTLAAEPTSVYFNDSLGTKVASIALVNSANKWFWSSNVLYIYSADTTTDVIEYIP